MRDLPRNGGQISRCGAPAGAEGWHGSITALDWGDRLQGKGGDRCLVDRILEKSVRVGIPCVLVGPARIVRVHLIVRFDGTNNDRGCGDGGGKGTTHFFESKE